MTRYEKLRKEAVEGCKFRGHTMTRFARDGRGGYATCKICGKGVSIIPFFSYEVIGEAVAIGCED